MTPEQKDTEFFIKANRFYNVKLDPATPPQAPKQDKGKWIEQPYGQSPRSPRAMGRSALTMNDQKQAYSPLPRTNFRGELIQSEPEILNRLLARAERAEAHAQRLADALKEATEELAAIVDNYKNGGEPYMTTEIWNEYTNKVAKSQDALAQWEGGKQ